jgi:hypothetical protein
MVEELKSQIEKTFGKKLNSRGDCELLSDDLHRKIGVVISYNTLRRLYGLAEFRQPRLSTLNHLSVILPESWTMSLVKEIQLNLLNHDEKNAKKIQPGIQGQGGFRSCEKSENACRIEPAF